MKFIRFGEVGAERPGLIDDQGQRRDLSGVIADLDPTTLPDLRERIGNDVERFPLADQQARLGCPITGTSKIVAVGLNYRDHCEECGYPIPSEPILFSKALSALSGPFDEVMLPQGCTKADWEVELAVVVGRQARYVPLDQARQHIAGYTICNDLTERAFQLEREGQWFKGKGCDTFAPVGPWLVTPDEVGDLSDISLWLDVNGHRMQDSSTRHMIFGPEFLLSYISQFMTLNPADIICTGTPPGVGMGRKPQQWLQPGDVMDLGVRGLGQQRQRVVAWSAR